MRCVMLVVRAILLWIAMIPLAILNGTVRVYWINPVIGEHAGHIVSSVTLSAIVFLLTWWFMRNTLPGPREAFLVGAGWVICTVLFEFVFGHYVMNHPWEKLLADYNVFRGRTWVLVLLAEFFSPVLALRLR